MCKTSCWPNFKRKDMCFLLLLLLYFTILRKIYVFFCFYDNVFKFYIHTSAWGRGLGSALKFWKLLNFFFFWKFFHYLRSQIFAQVHLWVYQNCLSSSFIWNSSSFVRDTIQIRIDWQQKTKIRSQLHRVKLFRSDLMLNTSSKDIFQMETNATVSTQQFLLIFQMLKTV